MKNSFKLVLASMSPRRMELLRDLGYEFTVINPSVDESFPALMIPEEIPVFLAGKKLDVAVCSAADDNTIFITADTIVICEGEIIGKPIDKSDAFKKLSKLSGKTHIVITGVCIGNKKDRVSFDDKTEVFVEALTDSEINQYISDFNVFDKAGAYGIQDWLGIAKISAIKGSYTNVMGLPTQKLWKEINNFIQKAL
jgi:septum formation protein